MLGEDPDTAQDTFEYKDPFATPGEGFTESLLDTMIGNSAPIIAFYEQLPLHHPSRGPRFYQSFKHLTLPEALIYHHMLHEKNVSTTLDAQLTCKTVPSLNTSLSLVLTLKGSATATRKWLITFDANTLTLHVHENQKKVGRLRYILRERKLEEIDGMLYGKRCILDPVWTPKTKQDLKEEYITFGQKRYSLLYRQNEKYALLQDQNNQKRQVSIKRHHFKKEKYRILTAKTCRFDPYVGQCQLLFVKGLLPPVGGQWTFQRA